MGGEQERIFLKSVEQEQQINLHADRNTKTNLGNANAFFAGSG